MFSRGCTEVDSDKGWDERSFEGCIEVDVLRVRKMGSQGAVQWWTVLRNGMKDSLELVLR